MNIMVRIGDEVITPPLAGTILPGVTRDSVLTLLREWGGDRVSERPLAIIIASTGSWISCACALPPTSPTQTAPIAARRMCIRERTHATQGPIYLSCPV